MTSQRENEVLVRLKNLVSSQKRLFLSLSVLFIIVSSVTKPVSGAQKYLSNDLNEFCAMEDGPA